MPAVSEEQRRVMAIAEHEPGKLYRRNRGLLRMTKSQLHDYASTKGLHRKKSRRSRRRSKRKSGRR